MVVGKGVESVGRVRGNTGSMASRLSRTGAYSPLVLLYRVISPAILAQWLDAAVGTRVTSRVLLSLLPPFKFPRSNVRFATSVQTSLHNRA